MSFDWGGFLGSILLPLFMLIISTIALTVMIDDMKEILSFFTNKEFKYTRTILIILMISVWFIQKYLGENNINMIILLVVFSFLQMFNKSANSFHESEDKVLYVSTIQFSLSFLFLNFLNRDLYSIVFSIIITFAQFIIDKNQNLKNN